MAEIGAIPAILAFPPEIFAQLDELCEPRGPTHHRLVVEAVKSQLDRWKQITDEVLTPIALGEIEVWPEDPLDLLACVVALHAMRLLIQRYSDKQYRLPGSWDVGLRHIHRLGSRGFRLL
jgi:hypothetical protein